MRDDDDDNDDFYDDEEELDFDEHEFEIVRRASNKAHWRRIEALKEQRWLKQQLDDFDDWSIDFEENRP